MDTTSVSTLYFCHSNFEATNELSDHGASQLIVDGKIKMKSDSTLERFTKNGLKFDDGSEVDADVVVFATGRVQNPPSFVASPDDFDLQIHQSSGIHPQGLWR